MANLKILKLQEEVKQLRQELAVTKQLEEDLQRKVLEQNNFYSRYDNKVIREPNRDYEASDEDFNIYISILHKIYKRYKTDIKRDEPLCYKLEKQLKTAEDNLINAVHSYYKAKNDPRYDMTDEDIARMKRSVAFRKKLLDLNLLLG